MPKEKVAVIDGGGRGHALVDAYSRSEHVGSIIVIPGNDMMKIGKEKPVKTFPRLRTTDVKDIVNVCKREGVSFVDVAQDNAVYMGVVDALHREGISALGPTRLAGKIEWSKAFEREFGTMHGLPQPEFRIFDSVWSGISYVKGEVEKPRFIKADGLAEGKGALPAENTMMAIGAIEKMGRFKNGAGNMYLIEDWLRNKDGTNGEEFSTFVISDGQNYRILGSAQDHKRVNNFDLGENTGGTGCSTPPFVLNANVQRDINIIFDKTINGLDSEGKTYRGILYLGGILIHEDNGLKAYVVEFNSRWGDPEAQAIVPGIRNDFLDLGMQAVSGNIKDLKTESDGKARVVIAGMSKGYPGNYDGVKGKQIFGLDRAMKTAGVKIYGAGVEVVDGKYYASGGRLFYAVGEGKDVIEARERAYSAMSNIFIDGNNLHYRTDIGWRDMDRLLRNG